MAYVPLTNHDQLSEGQTNGEACPGTKQVWLQWSPEQVLGCHVSHLWSAFLGPLLT